MRVLLFCALCLFVLSNTNGISAVKKGKENCEFKFDWANNGENYYVSFKIPTSEVLKSYEKVKNYQSPSVGNYEEVKEQFTPTENQPYKNKTSVRIYYEKFIAEESPLLKELALGLKESAPNKSNRGLAEHALAFVQSIPYSNKFGNNAGYITPIRVLMDNKGDCDSKSALLAAILTQYGIDWKLVDYPDHVLIAIDVPKNQGDSCLPDNGYVLAEPAGPKLRRLGSWKQRSDEQGVIEPVAAPVEPVEEVSEKDKITKLIEDAKLLITKRNTGVVGAKTTLYGLKKMKPEDYALISNKVKSGEIIDLGTYPNPRLVGTPTVVWAEEDDQPQTTPNPDSIFNQGL